MCLFSLNHKKVLSLFYKRERGRLSKFEILWDLFMKTLAYSEESFLYLLQTYVCILLRKIELKNKSKLKFKFKLKKPVNFRGVFRTLSIILDGAFCKSN